MKISIFTIASKNYLPYVRILMNSIAKYHPKYSMYLCLADKVDGYFNREEYDFEIVETDKLKIKNFQQIAFKYDIMEFNTAVKPFMFKWLFDNTDTDYVIYLDPDIKLFSKMNRLEEIFRNGASAVLTPHINKPLMDDKTPNDVHMLKSGVFNLGFISLSRKKEALDFIDWWGFRLQKYCIADFSQNLFVDQKWCDLAPCFLKELYILHDVNYNVAYWNLPHRNLEFDGNKLKVNGQDVVFFHFSGVDAENPGLLSKYQDRKKLMTNKALQKIIQDYIHELKDYDIAKTRQWPYYYGFCKCGREILNIYREVYNKNSHLHRDVKDCFDFEIIKYICNSPSLEKGERKNGAIISNLMYSVYLSRPDVVKAFPLDTAQSVKAFCHWFENSGRMEYGFPDTLINQNQIALSNKIIAPGFVKAKCKKTLKKLKEKIFT